MDLPWERGLIATALALGAREVSGWSEAEERLAADVAPGSGDAVVRARRLIMSGEDPLGDAFCMIRSPEERREEGATYTPSPIIQSMFEWARDHDPNPARIVDPGAGSGRFIVEAGRRFDTAELIAIELDPLAAMLSRGHLAAAGLASRATVVLADYRHLKLPKVEGRTLFIGNPPYVRHHRIGAEWKEWLTTKGTSLGLHISQLAGLHVHFFLATALAAAPNDFGAFITAAEWLDVNYGRALRELFLGQLGGQRLVVIEPTARPFPDAATTAAITCFRIGSQPRSIFVQRVKKLDALGKLKGGLPVRRERLESEARWSHLTREGERAPEGWIELGELCRVHRGQVTGANKVWIEGEHSVGLPESVLFPSVTKARELYAAGRELADARQLRRVIDLPVDLDELEAEHRRAVEKFLRKARTLGANRGYIATSRRAWWAVKLRSPAPILATYMARRPPAFVRNRAEARHINVAHGLYPRDPLDELMLARLVEHLATTVQLSQGRTYAGGLTKFEPREMERLLVPGPALLRQGAA